MENASKALIIAGAILISILLITVGIMIIQAANGVTGNAEEKMDSTAIQTFNSSYDSYVGSGRSAATIKSLCSQVIASNASSSHTISINGNSASSEISSYSASLSSKSTYTVTVTDTDDDGYYDTITIN